MDLFDRYFREDAIGLVLDKISDAIRAIQKHTYDSHDAASVWNEKFDVQIVETLLGVAFVLCQTYVTEVVSEAVTTDEECWRTHGRRLPSAMSGQKDRKSAY